MSFKESLETARLEVAFAYGRSQTTIELPRGVMVDLLQMIELLQKTMQDFEDEFNNHFLEASSVLHRTGWQAKKAPQ